MQALNKKRHTAFIAALQRSNVLLTTLNRLDVQADALSEDIRELQEMFVQYELLLSRLSTCIMTYEAKYKKLQQKVLTPQLREIRKKADFRSQDYRLLTIYLDALRASGI